MKTILIFKVTTRTLQTDEAKTERLDWRERLEDPGQIENQGQDRRIRAGKKPAEGGGGGAPPLSG
jgi:hypothetical protein